MALKRAARVSLDQSVLAAVSGCNVGACAFNAGFSCSAEHIAVGPVADGARCLTYTRRQAAGRAGHTNPDEEPESMSDTRIPEEQWPQFCASFTRQHHGWLVSMRQLDTRHAEEAAGKAHPAVRLFPGSLPLQELREARSDAGAEVMVTVGDGAEETSFLIENAVALYSRKSDAAHQGLRVDTGNGTTTLIEFRVAAEPETLDGLADSER